MDARTVEGNSTTGTAQADENRGQHEVAFELHGPTLSGDLQTSILDMIRHRFPDAWTNLLAHRQQRIIDDASRISRALVRQAVDIIASRDFETAEVVVGKFSIKGEELKGEYTTVASDDNMIAIRHAGQAILVLADPNEFFGTRKVETARTDEPELPLKDEADSGTAGPATDSFEQVGDALSPELKAAQRKFEEANEAAAEKQAKKRSRRRAEPEEPQADLEAARERGRVAFLAGEPGMLPEDLAGKLAGDAWLEGWDAASKARAREQDAAREPAMPSAPERPLEVA